jgi:PAS domain S-box-containing protein
VKRSRAPAASGSSPSRVKVFRAASPCSRALEEILAETADGAFVVNAGGFIVFWNRAAERLLGWSAQEVVGLACWEALAGADGNGGRLCGQGCQALRAGTVQRDVHRLEMRTRTKAGPAVWLDITALETPTTSGGRPLVVHLFRDVTATIRSLELIPRQSAALPGRAGLLSAREFQILGMMAAGANTRTMAAQLRVSPATIRNHAQSIFSKLGVHSRLEAVAWMYRHRAEGASGEAAAPAEACGTGSGWRDESTRADEPQRGGG